MRSGVSNGDRICLIDIILSAGRASHSHSPHPFEISSLKMAGLMPRFAMAVSRVLKPSLSDLRSEVDISRVYDAQ